MINQSWQAQNYADHASFVSELGSPTVSILAPSPGEHILDLGCGDGTLAAQIQRTGARVLGVDTSQSMVEAARKKGVETNVMNGQQLTFTHEFDAVFTNAALHWMPNYPAVIQGVYRALKTQGRFVGEFGGRGNIQCLIDAMKATYTEHPDLGEFSVPWFFPSEHLYAQALEDGGFRVDSIDLIPRPTPLKAGVRTWLTIFADYIIQHLNDDQTKLFLDAVEEKVRPTLFDEKKGWTADYVRLRFSAHKIS